MPAAKSIQPQPQLQDLPGPRGKPARPARPANQASRVIRDSQDNQETRAVQDKPVTKAALATVAVRAKLLRARPASIATPTQTPAVLPASAIESNPLG